MDIAIATEVPIAKNLTGSHLSSAPLYAALREDDLRARGDSVALRDLGGKGWAVFAKRVHPHIYERLFKSVERQGIQVKGVQHIMTVQEALPLVANQDCVSFVTQATARVAGHEGIVLRPIRDEEFLLHTALIMRAENDSRLVNSFVRAYIKPFQRKSPQSEGVAGRPAAGLRGSHP